MKLAVVGVGAVGSLVALRLARAGQHEIVACARRPFEALEVHDVRGVERVALRPLLDPRDARAVDWVLVCVKAYDSASTAPWLRALSSASTGVAVLQNGVEQRERFAELVANENLAPVVVDAPCERLGVAVTRMRGPARLTVADDELGRRFAELFTGTAIEVVSTTNWSAAAWSKLVLNCAGAARALLERSPELPVGSALGLARELALEAATVARAAGVVLPSSVADSAACEVAQWPRERVTSLEADLRAGRATEIDARNGAVVRIGRRLGQPTPWNELALERLGRRAGEPD